MTPRRGAARRAGTAVFVLLLCCAVSTACGATEENDESEPTTTEPVSPSSSTPDPEPEGDDMGETPIRVVIGDRTLSATVHDNPAGRALLDQLPLTLDFADYGGQEVLATLPESLPMDGMPAGESAPAGTIGYYAPDGVIVLYYTDVPRYTGIARLGRVYGDPSHLRGWREPRPVTLERAG